MFCLWTLIRPCFVFRLSYFVFCVSSAGGADYRCAVHILPWTRPDLPHRLCLYAFCVSYFVFCISHFVVVVVVIVVWLWRLLWASLSPFTGRLSRHNPSTLRTEKLTMNKHTHTHHTHIQKSTIEHTYTQAQLNKHTHTHTHIIHTYT